jgi:hypothetical protein
MSASAFVRYLHPHPQPDQGILRIEGGIAYVARTLLSAISDRRVTAAQRAPPNGLAVLTTTSPEGTHVENIIWRCKARGNLIETNACVIDRVMRHRGSVTPELDAGLSPGNGIGLKVRVIGGYKDSYAAIGYPVRRSTNPIFRGVNPNIRLRNCIA